MAAKQHFVALDGLRGLAAAAVMLRHLNDDFRLPQIVGHGYLAVDFFFILSGFVICWAYERKLSCGWSNAEFVRVRLVRLLPLIALGSILGGVITGLERPSLGHLVEATVLSIMALPCPWHGVLFPVNGPLWSMFYELISNGVYVLGRPFLGRKVLLTATGVAAAAVIFVALRVGDLDVGFMLNHGWTGPPRLAFPFLAGVVIYRIYAAERSTRLKAPAWALAVVLIAILVSPKGTGYGGASLDVFYSLIALPALVWFGVHAQVGPRLAKWCALAGELSYPVYVIHRPIGIEMGRLARHLTTPERTAAACACVGVVLSLAGLASRRYDAPIRRLLTTLTATRSRSNLAVALAGQRLSRQDDAVPIS